jgi:hypothetical protein
MFNHLFNPTAFSASLHFKLVISMSVIHRLRSRVELALSVILSPPRGYATDSWNDNSSATSHENDVKGNVH